MIAAVGYVSFYTYLARAITQGSSPTPEIGIFFDGNPHITILTASIIY
jgi:chromosomal replication initiation ATPase DnaA